MDFEPLEQGEEKSSLSGLGPRNGAFPGHLNSELLPKAYKNSAPEESACPQSLRTTARPFGKKQHLLQSPSKC